LLVYHMFPPNTFPFHPQPLSKLLFFPGVHAFPSLQYRIMNNVIFG
jgi:hypothetical protein